jgi:RimJ/RimL family protein N-acetyltransferase
MERSLELTSARLQLRTMRAGDWPLFLQLHQDEAVRRYVCDALSEAQIRARFDSRLLPWTVHRPDMMALVIERRDNSVAVGVIGLRSDWANRQAEVELLLLPAHHGQGFASEALQSLLQFAVQNCGYHKLVATVTQGNEPSLQLLQKHGFVQEGLLREHYFLGGQFADEVQLGLLARDWRPL